MADDILREPQEEPLPEGRWAPSTSGPGQMRPPSAPAPQSDEILRTPLAPTLAKDIGRTAATQAAKGVLVDIPALPGTAGQVGELLSEYGAERPLHWGAKKLGLKPEGTPFISRAEQESHRRGETPGDTSSVFGIRVPTAQKIERFWNENAPALAYEPYYPASQYAGSASRFATGAAGLGSLRAAPAAKRAVTGAISGLSSEAAGKFAQMALPEAEPFARFVGALAGGVGASATASGLAGAKQAVTPSMGHSWDEFSNAAVKDLRAAGTVNGSPISLRRFNEMVLAGEPVTLADIAGPNIRKLMSIHGPNSPVTREYVNKMNAFIAQRAQSSGADIVKSLENQFGITKTAADAKQALNAANKPHIDAAYNLARNHPDAQQVWSPVIADMFHSDRFKTTIKRVNELAALDETGTLRPHNFDAPGVASSRGVVEPATKPSLAFFDEAKRDFDGQIKAALVNGDVTEARLLLKMKNRLTGELDRIVPEYAQARSLAAENFGASNAIDAGYFSLGRANGMKRGQILENFEKLNDAEKALFRQGAADYLRDQLTAAGKGGAGRTPKEVLALLNQARDQGKGIFGAAEYSALVGMVGRKALLDSAKQMQISPDAGTKFDIKSWAKGIGAGALGTAGSYAISGAPLSATLVGAGSAGAYAAVRGLATHGQQKMARQLLAYATEQDPKLIAQATTKLGDLLQSSPEAVSVWQTLAKTTARAGAFSTPPSSAATEPQQSPFYAPRQAAGGRIQRRTGGRLGRLDHGSIAMSLIRAAEKAKKSHNTTTQPLLEQPDEAITKALAIADEALK
jgi:hypothetical protein